VIATRLRQPAAVLAALAMVLSLPFSDPSSATTLSRVLLFAAAMIISSWLVTSRAPMAVRLSLASVLAIGPTVLQWLRASWWDVSPNHILVALFGAHGLLYGAPLLWAGLFGLISLAREKPELFRLAAAAIVPGTLALAVAIDPSDGALRTLTFVPFLLPGLVHAFERAQSFATRRLERILAGACALLVVWNVLFMEQYRERLLPSDDTVSFSQVTSNSAALLSRAVGTPFAWPANWIFAWRFQAPPDRWDSVADRRLFTDSAAAVATIEIGDDASAFAPDVPLLLEGFSDRRTCERGWCRDLDGAGRLLLPLRDIGRGDLTIRVRARGEGSLLLSLNSTATSVTEMTDGLSMASLRVPARSLVAGINVLSLSVKGGGKATLDRITLERDPASGSAR